MVELVSLHKPQVVDSLSFKTASAISQKLLSHMNEENTYKLICQANVPKSLSSKIQECILQVALEIGFRNEAKGLFSSYENKALRPDYFMELEGDDGILLEIERGKTTINNMDLLDLWKCHICKHANYLFLMVPKELKQGDESAVRREFKTVCVRMKTFFNRRKFYKCGWGVCFWLLT